MKPLTSPSLKSKLWTKVLMARLIAHGGSQALEGKVQMALPALHGAHSCIHFPGGSRAFWGRQGQVGDYRGASSTLQLLQDSSAWAKCCTQEGCTLLSPFNDYKGLRSCMCMQNDVIS